MTKLHGILAMATFAVVLGGLLFWQSAASAASDCEGFTSLSVYDSNFATCATDIISGRHTVTVTPDNDSVTVAVSGSDLEESFHGVDVIDVETYFQVSPRGDGATRRFSIDGTEQETYPVASGYVGFYVIARLRDSDRRVVDLFISGRSQSFSQPPPTPVPTLPPLPRAEIASVTLELDGSDHALSWALSEGKQPHRIEVMKQMRSSGACYVSDSELVNDLSPSTRSLVDNSGDFNAYMVRLVFRVLERDGTDYRPAYQTTEWAGPVTLETGQSPDGCPHPWPDAEWEHPTATAANPDPPPPPPVVVDPPLTGRFENPPTTHDGTSFYLQLVFSVEPDLSYLNVRDHVLEVSNGQVENASRSVRGSDLKWHIKVRPTSASTAVEVTLPVTTDCEDDGAVCRGDEMLSKGAPSRSTPNSNGQRRAGSRLLSSAKKD